MEDYRLTPIAHEDLKTILETVIAENWLSKDLAKLLLTEMEQLHGEDRSNWLRRKLDEYQMLLDALNFRFFADDSVFSKIGLKIKMGDATKRLRRNSEN